MALEEDVSGKESTGRTQATAPSKAWPAVEEMIGRLRNGQRSGRKPRRAWAREGKNFKKLVVNESNPTERLRETRLTHAHRIEEPKWKELGVNSGW